MPHCEIYNPMMELKPFILLLLNFPCPLAYFPFVVGTFLLLAHFFPRLTSVHFSPSHLVLRHSSYSGGSLNTAGVCQSTMTALLRAAALLVNRAVTALLRVGISSVRRLPPY